MGCAGGGREVHRRSRFSGEDGRLLPAGEMGAGGSRRASEVSRRMHRAAPLTKVPNQGP